jgi:hypothetical protein
LGWALKLVFRRTDTIYVGYYIRSTQQNFPEALRLSTFEIEVIDYLDKRRNDPEVNRSMDFRPGDLLYLHNDRGVAFADRF